MFQHLEMYFTFPKLKNKAINSSNQLYESEGSQFKI